MNIIEAYLVNEGISFEKDVDLRKKTWIHRGGKADLFIVPGNTTELEGVVSYLYKNCIEFLVVGATSNLYILNTSNIPVVISTIKCNKYQMNGDVLECDCGVLVSRLSRNMISKGIQGFEYLTKLPGTIGAAIYNNSSVKCESNSITELLIDLDILTPAGIKRLRKEDLHLTFRSSDLKKHLLQGVILRARFKAEHGKKAELEAIMTKNEQERDLLLEGPAQNLGCTVHRMFCNGEMPAKYRIPYKVYSKALDLFVKNKLKQKKYLKSFLLTISRYRHLSPYISDRQLITFIWKDEKADEYFEEYLTFMRKVCKTDQIEIEIIK
jgi:UDP-N-acetylenolpyruvoylglucosamine reductase